MGTDKNTIWGFVLIGALLIAMFYFNSKDQLAFEGEKKRVKDSIDNLIKLKAKEVQPVVENKAIDSTSIATKGFRLSEAETFTTLENEVLSIKFSNKGAQPKSVVLKKFKKANGAPVVLNEAQFNSFNYKINSGENKTSDINKIFFKASAIEKNNADQSSILSFEANDSNGRKIVHQFILKPNSYMLDFDLNIDGVSKMLTNNRIGFNWQNETPAIEKDKEYELTQTHICHSAEQKFDFDYIGEGGDKEIKNANWLCIKQQFFISALISKNKFSEVKYDWKIPTDTTEKYLTRVNTNASYTFANQENLNIPLQLYFGPSDYNILKQYKNDLEYVVPYGSGIFSFVKYINRYFLLPVFDFIQKHVMNMGMVILLITLLIRLITSPILYKSYLSGAKMKVLKPEVDALKEKYKDDQQTFGMEQMKLWKSAGVSPLGGCLPALLQIPIFMSLYYFFQSNIDLRGKGFLWANDLAQYDSIATLPFSIPFYGDHVSLFTITAVITSLLISIYSMSNMQDNSNPLMKYMPYIFPVMLLGVFNKLPSALTWYYTISNTITLLLQIVIQKYIIDHDKIMLEIAENRKKPVKKSKMQERIESMQETQKKIQDMKQKSTKK
jgi:YidC/Oxa1 family membrane protein insertase